ncbi:MAG: ribonuclease P protein component [Prolixibacteraceae bacterium]|jgi:ribonuclease P protein component|nr:ribonuclease P protein component [Prolixibacteraceae bacterium]
MKTRYTFNKEERLCSKSELDRLFNGGKSVFSYPFKFVFNEVESEQLSPIRVVFSVPKRNFKKAVTRNLIRRRMREAYRLIKSEFYKEFTEVGINLSLMIIYVDKEIQAYPKIEKGMLKGMKKLTQKLITKKEKTF